MSQQIPFRDKHPYLVNLTLIAVVSVIFVFITLLFIDVFTSHGQEKLVPEVRNMPLEKAISKLESEGLKWEIADSTSFNESFKPGVITDQEPKAGSYIKAIRPVYLNVNAQHPRIVSLPKLQDMSRLQALAQLQAMGFKTIEIDTIESPYKDLIVQVLVNGRNVAPGTGVAINVPVRLRVGDGSIEDTNPYNPLDSATMDSIQNEQRANGTFNQQE
ncbi:MAG: PASTA domain-containing protein [Muribaculaceae bacterium]|nr:PASTA domain-containing protein [Muribaculaceae bacterium]